MADFEAAERPGDREKKKSDHRAHDPRNLDVALTLATDDQLAEYCECARGAYVTDETELRRAFSVETMNYYAGAHGGEPGYKYDSGQPKYSDGTLIIGDVAPNARCFALAAPSAEGGGEGAQQAIELLAPLHDGRAKKWLVLDFGSFS